MSRFLTALITILIAPSCFAQTDIYVRGSGKLFPVALPQLCLGEGQSNAVTEIPKIIARDLDLSGYFEVLNPNAFIETPGKCNPTDGVAYSDWTVIGAEGLVKGVIRNNNGIVTVQMYLHDVSKQAVVLGKEYQGDASQIPKIAHRFANEIMKFFTGEYGVFGTQISFSSRIGRFKELFVMDMDGSNIRQLTNEKSLALSSSWAPNGAGLVYTSYRTRTPDLFIMDIATKGVRQLTRGTELEVGGQFSKDGRFVLTSRTEGSDSDIVLLNLNGTTARRITPPNRAIDVSPVWSPDGSEIIFCSNRGGGPQIYRMGADGSGARRISFVSSNYCTSPAWSPKGNRIAFVCRGDGGFQLYLADADGSNAVQMTSGGDNEDPDWSPDGRYIVFSTTSFGRHTHSLAIVRNDGVNMKQITTSRSGDIEPSWGPLDPTLAGGSR